MVRRAEQTRESQLSKPPRVERRETGKKVSEQIFTAESFHICKKEPKHTHTHTQTNNKKQLSFEYFSPSKQKGSHNLGRTRGFTHLSAVCLGLSAECVARETRESQPSGPPRVERPEAGNKAPYLYLVSFWCL